MDYLAISIFLLKFNSLAIEIKSKHERLASMPVECHFRYFIGLNIFPDCGFEHVVAHLRLMATIDFRLVKVVAIVAIEVAE